MRARVAVVLVALATCVGYVAGREPPPRQKGPGAALRAYQKARIDALGECAKWGYATQWGDVAPDSLLQHECMSLAPQACTAYSVPDPREQEPTHGPRL